MDNIPEREQPKQERQVSIGEEFPLFSPQHVNRINVGMGLEELKTSIAITIESGSEFHFYISAIPMKTIKLHAITPFDANDGYHIDSRDFELKSRIRKIGEQREELGKNVDFSRSPNLLFITTSYIPVPQIGEKSDLEYKKPPAEYHPYLSKEALDIASRLRLLVSFPEGRYEARAWERRLRKEGNIWFKDFYPTDTKPLPIIDEGEALRLEGFLPPMKIDKASKYKIEHLGSTGEGFALFLPSDLEKLAQIQARFVLAPEELDPETSSG